MTSLKTSIKTITYLSDTGCLEIQGASLGQYNSICCETPLTDDELMQFVSSVFFGDKYESRSERYTYIPTINIINKLRDEDFQPFLCLLQPGA
ncbi:YubP [Escherichia coli]|nr:YubP [Escherichia coli]